MLVPKVFAGMIQVRIWPAVALSAPRLRTAEHTFVDNLGGFKPDPVAGNEAPEHRPGPLSRRQDRSEEHPSELQALMRDSSALLVRHCRQLSLPTRVSSDLRCRVGNASAHRWI